MDLERLVKERLSGRANCFGHCQEPYELKILHQEEMMIGSYTCASGYVSLMVHYGKQLDLNAFKTFLSSLLEDKVADEDLRVATRYNWDLGIEGELEETVLREAYWRQSYRRTKSDDPHRVALFQCTKCSSFYRQRMSDKNRLCPQCRRPIV
jgi:hypothetical protein